MDPTETIADTGFGFDPRAASCRGRSWLDGLANRSATIHLHAGELPHLPRAGMALPV